MRQAAHAEWTKLRTMPGSGWLVLALVVLTVGMSAVTTSIVKCPGSCNTDTTKLSLSGMLLGQAAVVGLALLVVTSEYSTGMIRVTLAATPRRSVMFAAKATVVTAVVLVAGAVSALGSLQAGQIMLPGNGFTAASDLATLTLAHGATLRAVGGSVLYLALIGLLSVGAAMAMRDSAVSATVLLGALYVIPVMGDLTLSPTWHRRIERWAPANAGMAIEATKGIAKLPIAPWSGLGVLGLWAVGALVIGWLVLRLRDA